MLKDCYSKYYFDQNYNCAETLLRAANEYYGLHLHDRDMILVGAYGAGIQCGNTCGAVLAAAAVLSSFISVLFSLGYTYTGFDSRYYNATGIFTASLVSILCIKLFFTIYRFIEKRRQLSFS